MGEEVRDVLAVGAWAALKGAFEAWRAGGLPRGAALVAEDGSVLARGRPVEPEMVEAALAIAALPAADTLDRLVDELWPRLTEWAAARRER